MALRLMVLASTLVLLAGGLAESAEIASGAVRVRQGDFVDCIAANAGTGTIANVGLTIHFNDPYGFISGEASYACRDVLPGNTCRAGGHAAQLSFSAFCEVSFSSGKVRATMCNVATGLCTDAR